MDKLAYVTYSKIQRFLEKTAAKSDQDKQLSGALGALGSWGLAYYLDNKFPASYRPLKYGLGVLGLGAALYALKNERNQDKYNHEQTKSINKPLEGDIYHLPAVKAIKRFSGSYGIPTQTSGSSTPKEIETAEKALGIKFPEAYKNYVANYGTLSSNSFSLTGLGNKGTNVVTATQAQRSGNKNFPMGHFILDEMGPGDTPVTMDSKGKVYSLQENGEPKLINKSLSGYLDRHLKGDFDTSYSY